MATNSTTRTTLWGACIGASVTVVASIVIQPAGAISGLVSPVMAAATLAAAVAVGAMTRSRAAGARALPLSA